MSDKAFYVDTSKCLGCRGCQVACKQWNGLPGEETEFFGGTEYTNPAKLSAITWNHVVFFPVDRTIPERPVWTIMHKKCFHCKEANCLRVCPEKAIYEVDGWKIIDQDRCIGCGACVNACVYGVPEVSEIHHTNDVGQKIVVRDKANKCNACLVNKREIPACVATCPTGSLLFGERPAMVKLALKRVKELQADGFANASVYGLDQYHGLRVITVLRDKPEKYGLPLKPELVPVTQIESTNNVYALLSSFTLGVPALKRAAYKVSKSLSKEA